MKKLLVVLLALSCLAAAAFADTALAVKGEVTYGIMFAGGGISDGWPNGYINFTVSADANNSAVVGLSWWNQAAVVAPYGILGAGPKSLDVPNLELAYIRSDIGGAMGISAMVDPVLYAGYGVYDLPGYQVTQYGSERIAAIGIDAGNANGIFGAGAGSALSLVALDTGIQNMAHVVLATSGQLGTPGGYMLAGLYGGVGPISFEVGWASVGTTGGFIPAGAQYSAAMGDIALTAMANVRYNANSGASNALQWSAGAKAVYQGMYTLDAAIISWVDGAGSQTYKMTGDLMANLSPTLGIVISPYFNFDGNAKDKFDTLEAFVWTTFGATKLRVGYLYTVNDPTDLMAGADYAPGNNSHLGGFWFTVDYNF